MGYADLLLNRDTSSDTRERWLNIIINSGQTINNMLNDLLNVSRIRSGKANVRKEKVKLYDVLENALFMVTNGAGKHEFILDIEEDLPDVIIDRDKFSHVIINLLSNAVKYSPDGGNITLSARSETSENSVVVSISDEGMGISREDRDTLFMTFHRIHRPETQGIRGSGLGLYIAKEWTEMMGGRIWFESELDKGSTFFVAFPAKEPDKLEMETPAIKG
jgi:signal transduction histidine kinase